MYVCIYISIYLSIHPSIYLSVYLASPFMVSLIHLFILILLPQVLERAVMHANNAYKVPHSDILGKICMTNLPSNTAFRGFGGPQGMLMMETIIDRLAYEIDIDPVEVCITVYIKDYVQVYVFNNSVSYSCDIKTCVEMVIRQHME